MVGLPLFGKEGSGTSVFKILVRALGNDIHHFGKFLLISKLGRGYFVCAGSNDSEKIALLCRLRVLGNANSGVFLRQLLVLYVYIFLLVILIYAKFFFC